MAYPTLIAEVGFGVDPSGGNYLYLTDPMRGTLDSHALAPDSVYSDVSGYVEELHITCGRQRIVDQYKPAQLTAVLNDKDARFDRSNLTGPYVSAGVSEVRPMKRVRIRFSYNGVVYHRFAGFADAWQPDDANPFAPKTILTATDAKKVLGRFKGPLGGAVGANEDAGARMNRLLDNAGWPAGDRAIDTGDTQLQATTFPNDALTDAELVADSEGGRLFVSDDGKVTFKRRTAYSRDTVSNTSQATFGDNGGLVVTGADIKDDDELVINKATITAVGGAPQVAQDAASQTDNFVHTYERTDLIMAADGDALGLAGWFVYVHKNSELRFDSIDVDPIMDPDNLFPKVLGLKIGNRVTISRNRLNRPTITLDCFIEGWKLDVAVDTNGRVTWHTKFFLSSASQYGSFFTLDNSALGLLDHNAVAY